MTMRLSFAYCLGVLFACALVMRAAQAAPTPEPSPTVPPKKLETIVVTAQRHPTPISETSRQTWVISPADLDRLGALTAADALRFIPGAIVQQYGAYGSLATVSLRGASSAQTLVLINGLPANEPDTGVFDFSSLPANVIDHVEVVQGGSSTLYGSSAMGGVINIITKQPVSAGNVNLYAQLGYQGTFIRGLGFTAGGPDMLARVDVQAINANSDFAYPAYDDLYPAGDRTNSDAKTSDLGVALSGHLGVVLANASFHDDTSAIGTPGSVPVGPGAAAFTPSNFSQQQRVYQRVDLDFDLPMRDGDVEFQVGTDGRRLHFFDAYANDPSSFSQFDNQANGSFRTASLRTTLGVGHIQTVTAGYDTSGDVVTFYQQYVPPDSPVPGQCQGVVNFNSCIAQDASSAWYVQDELHGQNAPLLVNLGVRDQRSQGTKPVAVPSFGAQWSLSDAVSLLANYARAFRTPNLDERYFPGYGTPNLQPEYGTTYDFGLRGHSGHNDYTLAWFGQDTSNLIINVPIDSFGDVAPKNVSRALVRGIESSLQSQLGNFFHLYAAYTDFLRAQDLTTGYVGNRLLYRPTSTAGIGAWVSRGTWDYGLDSTYVGRRYADEANTQLMRPYLLTGVHVKKILSRHLAITLRADNIANNHDAQDVLGYPVVGSAFSVRLSTR